MARMIRVVWDDAALHEGWQSKGGEFLSTEVVSVGFWLREQNNALHMCMSQDADDLCADVLSIPLGMIKRIDNLQIG